MREGWGVLNTNKTVSDDEVRKIMSTLNQKVKEIGLKFQESLKKENFKL